MIKINIKNKWLKDICASVGQPCSMLGDTLILASIQGLSEQWDHPDTAAQTVFKCYLDANDKP